MNDASGEPTPAFGDYYREIYARGLGGALAELDLTMALSGCTNVADLGPEQLRRAS